MEEKMTPQEWEAHVMEKFSMIDEEKLLDLAQDTAIRLAADLGQAKVAVRDPESMPSEIPELLCSRIGKMAIMLDVLQMRYGDCADVELSFLKDVESCFEE